MKINDILKTKIPFSAALLIIVAAATCTEQIFLQAIKQNNQANNTAVIVSLLPSSNRLYFWLSDIKEKVALTGASIPLIPEAKRITFDDGYAVRYRVNASAGLVANFYRQALANQGWRAATGASVNAKLEKLTIAYAENPLSKKTDITYAYVPANGAKVLGVKIAEADLSAPAPSGQQTPQPSQPMQPAPEQYQAPMQPSQPMQPAPEQYQAPMQPQPSMPNQYQPYPNQPLPDGQTQPQGPTQPMNQPTMNQMEFSRPPMQPLSGDQGGNQTCRVNGVDMPGSCEQYNNKNQGQREQDGQMNQGDRMGQPNQQGPSEEDMKKMDERRFNDMKKGLSQFANGAKSMKRNIAKVKTAINKCGVSMPEELTNALAQTDSLIGKINSAKTADELDEVIGDVQDVGSVMQDWGPRMGDLSRLCQMLKQADRDAKQFDRNVKRIETQAKANKKIDLSELLAEYKTAVSAQKDTLAQAKELAKTDPESALTKIEDDFYGNMDNLGNLQMQIDTIVNITKGLKNITRELNTFASQIKTLTKKKVDTADMQELLNTLKAQVAEIKDLIKNKAEAEELVNKVEETFDTRQELQDALQEYDMIKNMPQLSTGSNYNVKVNLPEVFRKVENAGDNGEATNEPGAKPIPTNPSTGSSGGNAPAQ